MIQENRFPENGSWTALNVCFRLRFKMVDATHKTLRKQKEWCIDPLKPQPIADGHEALIQGLSSSLGRGATEFVSDLGLSPATPAGLLCFWDRYTESPEVGIKGLRPALSPLRSVANSWGDYHSVEINKEDTQ